MPNENKKDFAKYRSYFGFTHNFLLIVIVLIGIVATGFVKYYSLHKPGEMVVLDATLIIEAPFSTSKVTITENGEVFYVAEDRSNNRMDTQSTKNISKSDYQELNSLIMSGNFFDLEDKPFVDTNQTDLSTYTLTVRTIVAEPRLRPYAFPGTVSVKCYEENCEPEFIRIKDKILELWGDDVLEVGI